MTPLQLWVQGQFESRGCETGQTVPDDYGIDWEGPVPTDNDEDDVAVANTECPLNEGQLHELIRRVEETGYAVASATPWESVWCYLLVKDFVKVCTRDTDN